MSSEHKVGFADGVISHLMCKPRTRTSTLLLYGQPNEVTDKSRSEHSLGPSSPFVCVDAVQPGRQWRARLAMNEAASVVKPAQVLQDSKAMSGQWRAQ